MTKEHSKGLKRQTLQQEQGGWIALPIHISSLPYSLDITKLKGNEILVFLYYLFMTELVLEISLQSI